MTSQRYREHKEDAENQWPQFKSFMRKEMKVNYVAVSPAGIACWNTFKELDVARLVKSEAFKAKQLEREELGRKELQALIMERFGEDTVRAARRKLCDNCSHDAICALLPITSKGEECPYFG